MPAKAPNNRTLTVAPDEVAALKERIVSSNSLPDAAEFRNLLINADLMQVIDNIPDGVADLIIIDPPYNLTKNFNGTTFTARSQSEYEAYLHTWFSKVCGKLKPHGSLYLCGDWKCTSALQTVMQEELTVLNRITWQREKGRGAQRNWKNTMEDIWFGVKDPDNYFFNVDAVKVRRKVLAPYKDNGKPKDWEATEQGNFRTTCPSNFWDDISVPFWSMPENTDHPTQKPEKLYAKLILASSKPGDVIFDPFMGSGTACVVAKKLDRRYIGVEINQEYCLWAAKRILMADSNPTIQGYADGVFWERNSEKR
ncbi:MAG: site-specific DNA-methyltransferase [Paludibacteraceae bacterium]|nr:site-specific DNA-methyltransferase [Paludibacteraceae bacterium]MBQ3930208.1 site-specific DNA-methyltransferase [Paludibacteraceae bacterium]MBQ4032738.1 site-specific DNA-methyltransferase [Paludibacteraceae bacterium]